MYIYIIIYICIQYILCLSIMYWSICRPSPFYQYSIYTIYIICTWYIYIYIYMHKCLITHKSSQTWSCLFYSISLNKDSYCRNYWSIHACKSMYVHSKSNMDLYSGIPRIASQNENIWKPPTNPWLINTLTPLFNNSLFETGLYPCLKFHLKKQGSTMGAVRSSGFRLQLYGFGSDPGSGLKVRYLPPWTFIT